MLVKINKILYLLVHACRDPAVAHMCTKFGVDSSGRFPFIARTHTDIDKVTDATGHPTHASATVGIVKVPDRLNRGTMLITRCSYD